MIKNILKPLGVASLLLLPIGLNACEGTYFTATGGFSFATNSFSTKFADEGKYNELTAVTVIPTPAEIAFNNTYSMEYNSGYLVSGEIGYGFYNGFHFGFTLTYGNIEVDSKLTKDVNMEADLLGGFISMTYVVPTDVYVSPYIGMGLGMIHATVKGKYDIAATNSEAAMLEASGSFENATKTTMAYNAKAGIGFMIAPFAEVLIGYEYIGQVAFNNPSDLTSKTSDSNTITEVAPNTGTYNYTFERDTLKVGDISFNSHNIELGLRFAFNA